MKIKQSCLVISLILLFSVFEAVAQGTAFTYSGRLDEPGGPGNGFYDLSFSLYTGNTNGNLIAAQTNNTTPVNHGWFTVTLDFGGVFNGSNYWLEIGARRNANSAFIPLTP